MKLLKINHKYLNADTVTHIIDSGVSIDFYHDKQHLEGVAGSEREKHAVRHWLARHSTDLLKPSATDDASDQDPDFNWTIGSSPNG